MQLAGGGFSGGGYRPLHVPVAGGGAGVGGEGAGQGTGKVLKDFAWPDKIKAP